MVNVYVPYMEHMWASSFFWGGAPFVNIFQGDTVDGRNPNNHLGWCWNPVNNGMNYQPQLVIAGFQPLTVVGQNACVITLPMALHTDRIEKASVIEDGRCWKKKGLLPQNLEYKNLPEQWKTK